MRLALRVLGHELLTVEIDTDPDVVAEEPELGPPFGFSGSGGGQVERADDWAMSVETYRGRKDQR